jgi:hypothetical protein
MKTCASPYMSHFFTYCNLIVSIKMKGEYQTSQVAIEENNGARDPS